MLKEWEQDFPNLGSYEETSRATGSYNCFAFAVEEQHRWWDPTPHVSYYWPANTDRDHSISTIIGIYKGYGYEICENGELEPDFDKIVLYDNNRGGINHVARQLPDGRWTSKMGPDEDIAHATPDALAGDEYGTPKYFMSRLKKKNAKNA
ncbi:MAG TPA: hypothetical protein VMH84_09035 [Xanthobacteraceae bacterium]|nr:hypothetical protein [Xanthobacteraceae bacterium]